MLEKWKGSVDNSKMFGALVTNLSRAFDCLDHKLVIAKLNAYGFNLTALKLVHNYSSNRKQGTKINSLYNSLLEIIFGVPIRVDSRTSIIFLIDLFFIIKDTDIASYADDSIPCVIADNIDGVIKFLEEASEIVFKWFSESENELYKN